jgi:hypothetical protein
LRENAKKKADVGSKRAADEETADETDDADELGGDGRE